VRFVGAGMVALSLLGPVLAAGCAGRRIEQGVYYSNKGYHVRIPGPEWTVVEESRADLELRPRSGQAGMLANATCEAQVARRSASVLQRQLLLGLPDRRLVEEGAVVVGGRPGTRTVVEAGGADGGRVRIETVTVSDSRCVYDLVYAASVDVFAERRADFMEFVASFTMER
jgi:hypothetical protein